MKKERMGWGGRGGSHNSLSSLFYALSMMLSFLLVISLKYLNRDLLENHETGENENNEW
jgi:hypothetical protein